MAQRMSNQPAIELVNLRKSFGRRRKRVDAVDGINLRVQAGEVFGFLGPNGAGKTTTIRMIMRLLWPTGGEVLVFGQDVRQRPIVLERVGALVEGASFYPFLTGRQNLGVLQRTAGQPDAARIDYLLSIRRE
jgi:ABC-2 type transport system ATP-binding protein